MKKLRTLKASAVREMGRVVQRLLGMTGLRLERVAHDFNPESLTRRVMRAHLFRLHRQRRGNFYFVQIGANDGVSFDDLFKVVDRERMAGLVVEPVLDYFQELVRNYRHLPCVTPVRAAIAENDGEVVIYRVDPLRTHELPPFSKGIASLDPTHHVKSNTPSEVMIAETVPSMSWATLLSKYQVDHVDYLQIDTEGYDAAILATIDFDDHLTRPSLIKFEHRIDHGVMSVGDFSHLTARLTSSGYLLVMDRNDCIAYLA